MYRLTPTEKTEFSKRLKALMESKGWHQSELARQADLPRDSISVYMRGVAAPTIESLSKLASALGVTPEDLLKPNGATTNHASLPTMMFSIEMRADGTATVEFSGTVGPDVAAELLRVLAPAIEAQGN